MNNYTVNVITFMQDTPYPIIPFLILTKIKLGTNELLSVSLMLVLETDIEKKGYLYIYLFVYYFWVLF